MKKQIYLAGQMTGLSEEEASTWRSQFKKKLAMQTGGEFSCFDPTLPFNVGQNIEKEAMLLDLDQLRHSRLVICNMNHPISMGTSSELALAWEWKIPIIGFCEEDNYDAVHPWWKEFATVVFPSIDKTIEYIKQNY